MTIKNAIMTFLAAQVDHSNYGMFSRANVPVEAMQVINRNQIRINDYMIYQGDTAMYRIKRKYAAHKIDGMYKQLKPTLETIKEAVSASDH